MTKGERVAEELHDSTRMGMDDARKFCTEDELRDIPEGTITFGLYLHAEEREQSESYWREKIAGEIEGLNEAYPLDVFPEHKSGDEIVTIDRISATAARNTIRLAIAIARGNS